MAVQQHPTPPTWEAVNWQLLNFIGEDADIQLTVTDADGLQRQVWLSVNRWLAGPEVPGSFCGAGAGTTPAADSGHHSVKVMPGEAAERAGLQAGDRIVAVNNDPVVDWYDWVERIRPAAGEALRLNWSVPENGHAGADAR